MSSVRRWSFPKREPYGAIAERHFNHLMSETRNICSIHFCCNWYSSDNIKVLEREQRWMIAKATKIYEIQRQYIAPDPLDIYAVSQIKANFWFEVECIFSLRQCFKVSSPFHTCTIFQGRLFRGADLLWQTALRRSDTWARVHLHLHHGWVIVW